MTTPTSLNWKNSTPEQRNDACACFMPPSDVNPLRSWHLYDGEEEISQISAISLANAEANLLAFLHANQLKRPPAYQIVERRRSVRYSDTPGGAWHLIEHLKSLGYLIAIATRDGMTAISAELYVEEKPILLAAGVDYAVKNTAFSGSEPFSELAAMLFLTLNGCNIAQ